MKHLVLCVVILFSTQATFGSIVNHKIESSLIFDLPIEYNLHVQKWINYFQNSGRKHFFKWLERHKSVVPRIQDILEQHNLPRDLVYMAMIESGFSPHAKSHKDAVGPWQFIKPTAERFGLKVTSWIDERKDIDKSTIAATKYLKYLHGMFGSWYLVAAAYNTGENRVHRAIIKYKTKNFWELVKNNALHRETTNYVPKLIAAMLIAKAPGLYGFRQIRYKDPTLFAYFSLPGGTNIKNLSKYLNVNTEVITGLNPELNSAHIPTYIRSHKIKIPLHSMNKAQEYIKTL